MCSRCAHNSLKLLMACLAAGQEATSQDNAPATYATLGNLLKSAEFLQGSSDRETEAAMEMHEFYSSLTTSDLERNARAAHWMEKALHALAGSTAETLRQRAAEGDGDAAKFFLYGERLGQHILGAIEADTEQMNVVAIDATEMMRDLVGKLRQRSAPQAPASDVPGPH